MLYQLKNNISTKSGFKIKNRGDCVRLSSMISIETDYDLSYNTLRRFYGIVKGTAPSERTLNILSKYVGFSSYKDFCFNSAWFFFIPFGLPFSNCLAVNDLVGVNLYSNFSFHTHRFMEKQSGVSVHNCHHAFGLFSAHPFYECNSRSS